MRGFLLVTNSAAGLLEEHAVASVVDELARHAPVEVAECGHPSELDRIVEQAQDRDIVVAGGDGSLHQVVNALDRTDLLRTARLGLVPLGTGNDFARGTGIPLDPVAAASLLVTGELTRIDLIAEDTGSLIVNNVHLGVGEQASRKAQKWKPRFGAVGLGRAAYAVGAVSAGLRPHFLNVAVRVDGAVVGLPGHVAQVAIGNGSHVGGGTELIPGARPGDGQLVVIVSRAVGRWTRLAYLARLRGGSHHVMEDVTRLGGRTVTVTATDGQRFRVVADGEISEPYAERTYDIRPAAVQMYLPPGVDLVDQLD